MDVNKFKQFVEFVAKKSQAGNPTPQEFNLALDRGYMWWIMQRYGNPNEYQVGNPIPRMAWQQTLKISDDLRFLLEKRTMNVDTNGEMLIPDGVNVKDSSNAVCPKYLHTSSVRIKMIKMTNGIPIQTQKDVEILRDSELGNRLSSFILKPSNTRPVCAFYDDHLQVYPKTINRVDFTYLRVPLVPVWGYTLMNNRPVYDSTTSVDIEAPDEAQNEIAMRVLSLLGISIREAALVQYSEQRINSGS